MKEILVIPFLLVLLFFGLVLYAADKSQNAKVQKVVTQKVVIVGDFELKPSVLVI